MSEPLRVAIVGGGVTGLAAAHALALARADGARLEVTLLEASDLLGGKVGSERVGDLLVERGPDSIYLRSPHALDLCAQLGLGDQIVRPSAAHRGSYILRGGTLHPIPAGMEGGVPRALTPLGASQLLSWRGKLRAAAEALLPRSRDDRDESIDAFVRRRFGGEVADRVAGPLLGGIYNNDPRRLSLLATMPHLRASEREHRSLLLAARRRPAPRVGSPPNPFISLRGGMGSLVDALTARLDGVDVRLETQVRAILPMTSRGAGFSILLAGGDRLLVDRVIVATPAHVAAGMLDSLSPAAAGVLASIRYASSVVVALAFPAGCVELPSGGGFVVAPDEPRLISAGSFASQKWPHCAPTGQVLLRCHLRAQRHPEFLAAPDRFLVDVARSELREVLGVGAEPIVSRVFRWPRALPSYEVGHLDRMAALDRDIGEHPGLVLAGAGYRGVGVAECLRQGTQAAARALALSPVPSMAPAALA